MKPSDMDGGQEGAISVPSPSASEQVVEVRFSPTPKILDRRGDWAELLTAALDLPEWQIIENRLDVLNKARSRHAFLSFRNMGYIAQDAQNPNQHRQWARTALRAVFKLPGFPKRLHVERVGVRGRFCVSFDGSFESLRDAVVDHYIKPSTDLLSAFGKEVELQDIGAPLVFSDPLGSFNTQCGPMRRAQLEQFFKNRKNDLPEVGLYFDVDYWLMPGASMDAHDLGSLVEAFGKGVWARYKQAVGTALATSSVVAVAATNGS